MKRIYLLLLVAISFAASNAQIPDIFYNVKPEGAFSSFFCGEVKSIQYSKTDAAGVVHEKYLQIIETSDNLYSMPLSNIKEVSFTAPTYSEIENGITLDVMVDLGLSVMWASHNIGATVPEESGGLYGWADPIGTKESEDQNDYPNAEFKEDINGTEYDIAHVKWGGTWRMATKAEQKELIDMCSWTWIVYKGVNGMKVTGPNGNSIFLPASNYRLGSTIETSGNNGYYWSGTFNTDANGSAASIAFDNGGRREIYDYANRALGYSVRPVSSGLKVQAFTSDATYVKEYSATCYGRTFGIENITGTHSVGICYGTLSNLSATNGICAVNDDVSNSYVKVNLKDLKHNTTYYYRTYISYGGEYIYGGIRSFTTEEELFTPGEYIDLGLSVKWASCNAGSTTPDRPGTLYKWNDALSFNLPTLAQTQELSEKCTWKKMSYGIKVTGPNGNSIFLHLAGFTVGGSIYNAGLNGGFWTSTPFVGEGTAYCLSFDTNGSNNIGSNGPRIDGYSVRTVSEK